MLRLGQKGDTPMTEKDREQFMEVLLALGGYNTIDNQKNKVRDFTPCQLIYQSKPETPENTDV